MYFFVPAPVSMMHVQEYDAKDATDDTMNNCGVSSEEIREFLMPIVGQYFKEETDLAALEILSSEPRKKHIINEVSYQFSRSIYLFNNYTIRYGCIVCVGKDCIWS